MAEEAGVPPSPCSSLQVPSDLLKDGASHQRGDVWSRQVSKNSSASAAFDRQVSDKSTASVWSAFTDGIELQIDSTDPTPLSQMPELRVWEPVPAPKVLKDSYRLKEHLGSGSFASVLVGKHLHTGEKRAVKILPLAGVKEQGLVDAEKEVMISAQMQHPYIAFVYEAIRDEQNLYLITELCKGGDLGNYVRDWPQDPDEHCSRLGLPVELVGKYLWQMLAGIAYLHHHHIIHRDIKCDNYLLKSRSTGSPLKLIDFGFACKVEPGESLKERLGTPCYVSPEIMQGTYNEKCDLYAIGVCGFYMCTKSFPYDGETVKTIVALAAAGNLKMDPKVWESVPSELQTLVRRLLSVSPAERPSALELLKDRNSWLRKVGWDPKEKMLAEVGTEKACCAIG
eukprot:TRINITY_DN93812_c0_g1_i1.p1 TRINITY_DN93812_c0_g1~~TRINITY_DN93812_c0_g1_i1.p1  ORF type:complete len:396 (+),score=83.66 TRINITY_DN93812_c0_g1_i1:95-1282(+)